MRRIAVLDAPSNLGLRPPTATSVPGCAKAPGALRDHGLISKLNARDAGCLTPPRYDAGDWRPGDGVAHAAQIAAYSRALADRIGGILDAGEFPVVLGGDCSILLGSGLAMNRLGESVGGRIGLIFVDGHSDFRHPGNASYVGAAAGEDLALVTGRGQADLAAIEGRRPYFRDVDVVVMGIRAQDEYRLDLQAAGIVTRPVPALRAEGAARSAQWARDQLVDCAGYWVHMDVDVLDPAVMPAVDAPSPGGIAFPELEILLAGLVESPHCLGVEITVFDPDYDPDGSYAAEIVSAITSGLANAHSVTPRPDLIAARADLSETVAPADEAPAGEPGRLGPSAPRFNRAESLLAGPNRGGDGLAGLNRDDGPAGSNRGDGLTAGLNRGDDGPAGLNRGDRPPGLNRGDGEELNRDPIGPSADGGGLNRRAGGLDHDTDLGRLNRGEGGAAGLIRPRSPIPRIGRTESLIAGFSRGGSPAAGLRRPVASAAAPDDEHEREQRRAAAAAESVSLAAAGMSEGVPGAPEEVAIPATTLLGVEEADDFPPEHAGPEDDGPTRGGDESAAAAADDAEAARGDADAAGPGDADAAGPGDADAAGAADGDAAGPGEVRAAGPDDAEAAGAEDARAAAYAADGDEGAAGTDAADPTDHWTDPVGPDRHAADAESGEGADADGWTEDARPDGWTGDADPDGPGSGANGPEDEWAEPTDDAERADAFERAGEAERADAFEQAGEAERVDALEPAGDAELDSAEPASGSGPEAPDDENPPVRLVPRPLGQAPLLDSEPLPATRPGMLRPRSHDEEPFSLPTQRPAFDLGSGAPADVN